ncbi:CHAT domain-containing protein [Nonomuraea roseoviolacea]|uniref:Tetratricopeptide (TPR) repeat protein n=1 Tax=Nonomuraea roseoviolacea subsp. carminata TaxID=160689 RepID=A0ABT1K9Q3_9ACTN|nr:CHAT domain-containing protein [Nonomuraea roseoviolacea]MCP2349699.1 tetratricopeptide (TPR) repeat protein [Nonomuraea roseoviolacea subsp. carminata]
MTHGLVEAAEAAVLRSVVDPAQAMRAAQSVLTAADARGMAEAAVVALRAMGLAARELGDLPAAERHLRRAVATSGAPPERLAQARLSLVTVRTERGHPVQALRIAALAWPALSSLDRAKLDTQRAVALAHLGRYRGAVAACDRAVEVLAAAPGGGDDHRFLAGGLLNRGLVRAFLGEWDAAMGDVTACLELARHAGLDHLARLAAANLPFLAVRRGDVAGAFGHYREAEEALFGFAERLATMRADFAGALLAAQQPGEARELLSRAVPDLEASGAHVALADARLKLARAELLTGDPRRALALAVRAGRELEAQGRASWLPLAREVVLRARLALDGPAPGLLAELVACAGELERDPAHQAGGAALRLEAAEAALALGDRSTALGQLAELTNAPPDVPAPAPAAGVIPEGRGTARRVAALPPALQELIGGEPGPPPERRVPGLVRQHALALEAELRGDTDAALRAAGEGLAEARSQAGAFEDPGLRAHMARAGERLAGLGLRLAARDRDAAEVFAWAERWRAVAAPEAYVPDLREVRAALAEAAPGGRGAGTEGRAVLSGSDAGAEESRGAVLLEFVVEGASLLVVVVTQERALVRRLGRLEEVAEAVVRLRYALRRHTLGDGPAVDERTALAPGGPVPEAAGEVERLLLRPVEREIAERPLVVVPAGVLHTVPWAALPCLRGRPVSVAASAAAWLAAGRRAPVPDGAPVVAAAAGPGLAHARTEVDRVLAGHPRGREVPARTGPVMEALAAADVLHLAAHGVFHARSPLLSSITLDDGPLMAYDLLRLPRSPGLVVLSACDAGMARVPAEGALLGLAGAFLARGTACVVAGMVPVRDDDARAVMTLFHELLAHGEPPASALAAASAKTEVPGFICFGAGHRPVTPPA